MKSEKAMEYIGQHDWPDENTNIRSIYCYHVQDAIEIAEQEAEERMREKALSAFDDMWFENGEDGEFEPDYEYHRRNFIKKMNE